jgi:hypothetical protein
MPEGKFMTQNARIGEEIIYSLSVRYPRELNLVFPDSTYRYDPFELVRREYFETVSDSLLSFDSAVYYMSTFEIDSVQLLQLPVFVLSLGDCTAVYSKPDSIILTEVIEQMPQQPELKSDTAFWDMKRVFNYPLLGVVVACVLVAGLLIFMIFGKQLKKAWLTMKLRRAHKRFTSRFFNLMRNVSGNNPSKSPEFVLAVWKRYMERLEGIPISKLTTKEIYKVHPDPLLRDHLRSIDRIIYGDARKTELFASFDFLLKFAVAKYHERIEELKHG